MGLLHGISYVSIDAGIDMKPVQGVAWWRQELLSYRLSEDLHLLCQQGDSGAFRKTPVNLRAGFTESVVGLPNVSSVSPAMEFKLI